MFQIISYIIYITILNIIVHSIYCLSILCIIITQTMQAGAIPLLGLFHHENLPNFVHLLDIPRIGEFSHNLASSAASAASTALGGFRSYMDDFRTGLGGLNIPPNFGLVHRFINGGLLSGLSHPAILNGAADTIADSLATSLVPSEQLTPGLFGRGLLGRGFLGRGFLGRGLLGNYETGGLNNGAASAAASAAATGA